MNPLAHHQRSSASFLFALGSGLVLTSSLILFVTNPSSQKYEKFATEQLVIYAKENICSPDSDNLEEAIKSQVCNLMIDTGRSQIPRLIRETTQRRNYVLFSVYETDLFLYEFEVLGLFNNFYIIDVYKREVSR